MLKLPGLSGGLSYEMMQCLAHGNQLHYALFCRCRAAQTKTVIMMIPDSPQLLFTRLFAK